MFGQIPPTQYDLNFEVLGVPVRVHPMFWITTLVLAWVPGAMDVVLVRMLCIFVSIMVHELGHAVVTRHYGWQPEIVLYFFGGYATSVRHTTWRDIAVSAAGPLAGFGLFFATLFVSRVIETSGVEVSKLVLTAIHILLWFNLFVNLMNLIPVEPLDGGQISRELFHYYDPRNGPVNQIKFSMIVSGAVALWAGKCHLNHEPVLKLPPIPGFSDLIIVPLDPLFLALMFGYLCYQNFQRYEQMRGGLW